MKKSTIYLINLLQYILFFTKITKFYFNLTSRNNILFVIKFTYIQEHKRNKKFLPNKKIFFHDSIQIVLSSALALFLLQIRI